MTEFMKGDVVTVRATVKYPAKDDLGPVITIDGHYQTILVNPEQLTLVHHKFEVGDRVRILTYKHHGIVRAIHDDFAWIQTEDSFTTNSLDQLEHAPVAPVAAAESDIPH